MSQFLLDQFLDPLTASFSDRQVEQILFWQMDTELENRLNYLREQAKEGLLSEEEDSEYKQFVEDLDLISLIQLKARRNPSVDAA